MELIKELLKLNEAAEKYVVICNAGRGKQATWPSSEKPGLYSKAEADKIVKEQNGKQTAFNSPPGGHYAWHAQPLSKALEYISYGNKCYGPVKELQDQVHEAQGMFRYTINPELRKAVEKVMGSNWLKSHPNGHSPELKQIYNEWKDRLGGIPYEAFIKVLEVDYRSPKKLDKVPVKGYLVPASAFEETEE